MSPKPLFRFRGSWLRLAFALTFAAFASLSQLACASRPAAPAVAIPSYSESEIEADRKTLQTERAKIQALIQEIAAGRSAKWGQGLRHDSRQRLQDYRKKNWYHLGKYNRDITVAGFLKEADKNEMNAVRNEIRAAEKALAALDEKERAEGAEKDAQSLNQFIQNFKPDENQETSGLGRTPGPLEEMNERMRQRRLNEQRLFYDSSGLRGRNSPAPGCAVNGCQPGGF